MAKTPIREKVKALIEAGTHTKEQIAEELDTTVGNVSSNMTYLRWMGHFIKWDTDKVLTFCTEEEYESWQAEIKSNRKTTASTRTPEEQAVAMVKTIARQEKQLGNWKAKAEKAESLVELIDDDTSTEDVENFQDLLDEAKANVTLLAIKIRRNKKKQQELPEVPDEPEEVEAEEVVEAENDEELL